MESESEQQMAVEQAQAAEESSSAAQIIEARLLLWGSTINLDIFRRWSQGFEFSEHEPIALVQHQGGPCAVLAPVQAAILKIILATEPSGMTAFSELTADRCRFMLIEALCSILEKCKSDSSRFRLINVDQPSRDAPKSASPQTSEKASSSEDTSIASGPSSEMEPVESQTVFEWTPDQFHERLVDVAVETIDDVRQFYTDNVHMLTGLHGILLFMYSVLLTKTLADIEEELLDTSEPLIHDVYGYASQALINLMLTGRAVPNVWDNDQDVGGLKLKGINRQSDIGFITLMEQMRYLTVGSFYKNPKHPVWVMGSETHLSVLFSNENKLVSPETPGEIARRVFKSFDPDGNNFIAASSLQDVLAALNLVSETEYVEIMQKRLDPEGLGIILLNAFMDEFFACSERPSAPDTFELFHYNGIPGSNEGQQVKFHRGSAVLLECELKTMCQESNAMLTCLQTKWPTIEVNWANAKTPSLN